MYNELNFKTDFVRAYGRFGLTDKTYKNMHACYQTYVSSSKPTLGMLIVGRIVKKDANGRSLPMIGLDDIERTNFGISNKRDPGSVLWSRYWSIPLNDAWLMGGIHAGLDFYLASPRTKDNIYDEEFGLTVTGRELLGLTTFGYKFPPKSAIGDAYPMQCADRTRASNATFQEYEKAFQSAKSDGSWEQLVG
jgi:hypothetical protein